MVLRLEDFGDKASGISDQNYELSCLARSITVNINDYTKADTFSATIDYKSFPFDPRCIRSLAVTIAIQDMGRLFTETNSLNPIGLTSENAVFMGFADEESIKFDDTTRTVQIDGRDNTALLLDRKFLEGNISLDKPLDEVVRGMIQSLEETKNMTVDVRFPGPLPVLASFFSDKGELSGKKNLKKGQSYWDVIQSIVQDAGLIAYVELDRLVISKPRVLYDRNEAKRFVYGKNLKNLDFKRKIGRKKGFNIVVRSLDIESKTVIEALIPKEATDAWSKETGIPNIEVVIPKVAPATPSTMAEKPKPQENQLSDADAEAKGDPAPYIAFRVANVSSKQQLIEIAQGIYEEIGRQQIEGSFETREMKIKFKRLDGKEEIFDICKLRIGMPIVVEIDDDDLSAVRKVRSQNELEDYLVSKKYESRVARSLAQSIGRSNTPFYTKAFTFTMDAEQGFNCEVEFLNFIETKSSSFKDVV